MTGPLFGRGASALPVISNSATPPARAKATAAPNNAPDGVSPAWCQIWGCSGGVFCDFSISNGKDWRLQRRRERARQPPRASTRTGDRNQTVSPQGPCARRRGAFLLAAVRAGLPVPLPGGLIQERDSVGRTVRTREVPKYPSLTSHLSLSRHLCGGPWPDRGRLPAPTAVISHVDSPSAHAWHK